MHIPLPALAVAAAGFLAIVAVSALALLAISIHRTGRGPLSQHKHNRRGAVARRVLTTIRSSQQESAPSDRQAGK